MSEIVGASKSLRANIKIIRSIINDDRGSTSSPRLDYDVHLNALIEKAYKEGFKRAHRLLREKQKNGKKVPKTLHYKANVPAVDGKQKFDVVSPVKEN